MAGEGLFGRLFGSGGQVSTGVDSGISDEAVDAIAGTQPRRRGQHSPPSDLDIEQSRQHNEEIMSAFERITEITNANTREAAPVLGTTVSSSERLLQSVERSYNTVELTSLRDSLRRTYDKVYAANSLVPSRKEWLSALANTWLLAPNAEPVSLQVILNSLGESEGIPYPEFDEEESGDDDDEDKEDSEVELELIEGGEEALELVHTVSSRRLVLSLRSAVWALVNDFYPTMKQQGASPLVYKDENMQVLRVLIPDTASETVSPLTYEERFAKAEAQRLAQERERLRQQGILVEEPVSQIKDVSEEASQTEKDEDEPEYEYPEEFIETFRTEWKRDNGQAIMSAVRNYEAVIKELGTAAQRRLADVAFMDKLGNLNPVLAELRMREPEKYARFVRSAKLYQEEVTEVRNEWNAMSPAYPQSSEHRRISDSALELAAQELRVFEGFVRACQEIENRANGPKATSSDKEADLIADRIDVLLQGCLRENLDVLVTRKEEIKALVEDLLSKFSQRKDSSLRDMIVDAYNRLEDYHAAGESVTATISQADWEYWGLMNKRAFVLYERSLIAHVDYNELVPRWNDPYKDPVLFRQSLTDVLTSNA